MRRWIHLLLLGSLGCSTAPLAGFLDRVAPGGVSNRENPPKGGDGFGSPRPIDPLVETPPRSIPSGPPSRPLPKTDPLPPGPGSVVPPPTLESNLGPRDPGQTASFRRIDPVK